MNALGIHLLLELKACDPNLLDDLEYVRGALLEAASSVGATVVGDTFHKFSPYGVTGIVAIAESHLCIHTWPEHGYAAADIFTCGDSLKPRKAAAVIVRKLKSREPTITEIRRGLFLQDDADQKAVEDAHGFARQKQMV